MEEDQPWGLLSLDGVGGKAPTKGAGWGAGVPRRGGRSRGGAVGGLVVAPGAEWTAPRLAPGVVVCSTGGRTARLREPARAGAGVPVGVGGGGVTVASADGLACVAAAVEVGVGTTATFRSPTPERARGMIPSKRKRIAMSPMPQRA